MPNFAQRFEHGRPRGVSQVTKDAAGRLQSWVENGFTVTVARDSAGKPTQVVATSLRGNVTNTYNYDANGVFQSITGRQIPSVFWDELLRDAGSIAGTGRAIPEYSSISANKTLTNDDIGQAFICTTAITITVPVGLSAGAVRIVPPPSGNVTIASDGTATLNGATTSITRSRANNWAGFGIISYGGNAAGVGGA